MRSDQRERILLPPDLVTDLASCAVRLDLRKDASSLDVIKRLVDQCLRLCETSDPPGKRVRGSTTGAERDLFSETALSALGWEVTNLKRREVPQGSKEHSEKLNVLSEPFRQLVLLFPETCRTVCEWATWEGGKPENSLRGATRSEQ